MSKANHRSVVSFHSPTNRLARVPLAHRAHWCAEEILAAVGSDPPDLDALCRAMNRGSLALAMAGGARESEDSCLLQMRILASLVGTGRVGPEHALRAVQPWINIGRLRMIQGRYEEALAHFPGPAALTSQEGIQLGPVRISPAQGAHLDSFQPFGTRVAESSHVVDTARAHASVGRVDLLLAHLRWWSTNADTPIPHVREGLVALEGGEEPAEAPEGSTEALEEAAVRLQLVDRAPRERLVHAAKDLAARLLALFATQEPSGDLLAILTAGASTCARAEVGAETVELLERAASVAEEINDEVGSHQLALERERLGVLAGAGDASVECALRAAHESDYAMVRRSMGLDLRPVETNPSLAPLFSAQRRAESVLMTSGSGFGADITSGNEEGS